MAEKPHIVVRNDEVIPLETVPEEMHRVKILLSSAAYPEDLPDIVKLHLLRRKRYRVQTFQEALERLKQTENSIS